jgi:hypothetical protein
MGVRRDLLRVLLAAPDVRADLIPRMYHRSDTRELAKVLGDLEANEPHPLSGD